MAKGFIPTFSILFTVALSSLAQADTAPVPVKSIDRSAGLTLSDYFMQQFDTDGDRQVSLPELAQARTAEFLRFDMDGDRTLNKDEYARLTLALAAREARPELRAFEEKTRRILGALSLEESDLDQNGTVSKAEYQGNSALWFEAVDRNQDGAMSAEELEAW